MLAMNTTRIASKQTVRMLASTEEWKQETKKDQEGSKAGKVQESLQTIMQKSRQFRNQQGKRFKKQGSKGLKSKKASCKSQ